MPCRFSPLAVRCGLAAAALTVALALAPAMAQVREPGALPPPDEKPEQSEPSVAGLPLYTSDGKEIGTVIAAGLDDDDEPVLVAEIAQPLGLGPMAVAVPADMYVRKGDRVELTITEAEVNDRLKQ